MCLGPHCLFLWPVGEPQVELSVDLGLVRRVGLALMAALSLTVVMFAVPGLPPIRSMIEILGGTTVANGQVAEATVVTGGTVITGAIALWLTSAIARMRF